IRGKVPRSSSGNWGHQLFPSARTTPSHSVIQRPSGYAYSNLGWTSRLDGVAVPEYSRTTSRVLSNMKNVRTLTRLSRNNRCRGESDETESGEYSGKVR